MLWGCIFIQGSSPQPIPAGWCVWHHPSCALYAQVHKLYGCIWIVFSSGLEIPEALWQVGKGNSVFFGWFAPLWLHLFLVCRCWQFWSSSLLSGCAQTDRKWLSPWTSSRFQPAGFLDAFGAVIQASTKPDMNTLKNHKFHSNSPLRQRFCRSHRQSNAHNLPDVPWMPRVHRICMKWNGSCLEPEACRLVLGRFPMTSSSWRFFLFGRSPVSWHLDVTSNCYFFNCRVSICQGFEEGPLHADWFHHYATRPKTVSNKKTQNSGG